MDAKIHGYLKRRLGGDFEVQSWYNDAVFTKDKVTYSGNYKSPIKELTGRMGYLSKGKFVTIRKTLVDSWTKRNEGRSLRKSDQTKWIKTTFKGIQRKGLIGLHNIWSNNCRYNH